MNRKSISIIIITIIMILLMYVLDQVLQVSYLMKTSIKLIFLSVIPIIYLFITRESWLRNTFSKPLLAYRKITLALSLVVFIGILAVFVLLKEQLDVGSLMSDLVDKYGINKGNFLFVGIYITVFNSFFEEFFFRGFIFLNLINEGHRLLAYLFSSIAFALYHIAIFLTWFSPWVFLLALTGLSIGGLIFNCLDHKPRSILGSWMVHASADVAIILIGFYLFAQ
jgi:membrane protease YdiL (CAAX protease family)